MQRSVSRGQPRPRGAATERGAEQSAVALCKQGGVVLRRVVTAMTYLTRARLNRRASSGALAPLLCPRDQDMALDLHHRLVWSLFPAGECKRDFLWRAAQRTEFLVLSQRRPSHNELFEPLQVKTFAPDLEVGDRLRFTLRVNATKHRLVRRTGQIGPASHRTRTANGTDRPGKPPDRHRHRRAADLERAESARRRTGSRSRHRTTHDRDGGRNGVARTTGREVRVRCRAHRCAELSAPAPASTGRTRRDHRHTESDRNCAVDGRRRVHHAAPARIRQSAGLRMRAHADSASLNRRSRVGFERRYTGENRRGGWDSTVCDIGIPARAGVKRRCLPRRSTIAVIPRRRGGEAAYTGISGGKFGDSSQARG